jgi:hypothetical protein
LTTRDSDLFLPGEQGFTRRTIRAVTRRRTDLSVKLGIATVVLLVAVGCGRSHSEPETALSVPASAVGPGTGAPTRQGFIDKATSICATALLKTGSLPKPTSADPAAHLAYLQTLAPILDEELNGLKAIPVPIGDEAKISLIIGWVNGEKGAVDAEISTLQDKAAPPDLLAKAMVGLEDGAAGNAERTTQDAHTYGFAC